MLLQTIEILIGHWVTLIKAHEKLLLALIVAVVLFHYGNKGFDAYDQYLKNKQSADNAQIAALHSENAKNADTLAKLVADVDARFKADEERIAKAKTTIVVQQKKNDAMTPPELYTHWQADLALPEGSIKPQEDGTAIVSVDAAHTTVNEIDKVAPLTEQLIATQDELKGCTDVRNQQTTQIAGLNSELTAEKKGRSDDAAAAKTAQGKAYKKGFKHGFIAGVVATTVAVVAIFK